MSLAIPARWRALGMVPWASPTHDSLQKDSHRCWYSEQYCQVCSFSSYSRHNSGTGDGQGRWLSVALIPCLTDLIWTRQHPKDLYTSTAYDCSSSCSKIDLCGCHISLSQCTWRSRFVCRKYDMDKHTCSQSIWTVVSFSHGSSANWMLQPSNSSFRINSPLNCTASAMLVKR